MKINKNLALAVLLILVLCLCACSDPLVSQLTDEKGQVPVAPILNTEEEEGTATATAQCQLALICESSELDEEGQVACGYALDAWAGLSRFAAENNISAALYPASEPNQAARLAALGQAVEDGAQLIAACGPSYEDVIYEAQNLYPHVSFVLCDGEPHSLDFSDFALADNTYAVFYAACELGFLAGYALVSEGCTKLGFLGTLPVPEQIGYGAGFLQGVNQAAEDKEVKVTVNYTYSGLLGDDPSLQNLAGSWYANGVEAIYATGDFTASVASAAEAASAFVVAPDWDQYRVSSAVVSSAVKNVGETVYQAASAWQKQSFWGGKQVTLGVGAGAVSLAMTNARFITFTPANLKLLLNRFEAGEVSVQNVSDASFDLSSLCGEQVTLTEEKQAVEEEKQIAEQSSGADRP